MCIALGLFGKSIEMQTVIKAGKEEMIKRENSEDYALPLSSLPKEFVEF